MSWLWRDLHDLFDTDDGSLPEIRVDYRDPEGTRAGYVLLRQHARRVLPFNASVSVVGSGEIPIDRLEDPAGLVTSRRAQPFHVVLTGVEVDGTGVPDLGVWVFPDQLALDYRMGPAWSPRELHALFALLLALTGCDPNSSISLQEGVPVDVVDRVGRAWSRFRSEHAAQQ